MKVKDLLNETQEFSKFCNHLYILCKNINHGYDDAVIISNMYITILNFFRVKKKPKFMNHVEILNYIRDQLLTWEVKFHQLKPYYRPIKISGFIYIHTENILRFEERKWEYGSIKCIVYLSLFLNLIKL